MENKKLLIGLALTGMVLGTSYAQSNVPQDVKPLGECHGINACKGTGACGGKGHSCAGKNACKGKGWIKLTEKECLEKDGTFKNGGM